MTTKTIIKLGTKVTDLPTGQTGLITHLHIEQDGRLQYLLQPNGLNPKDGQPVKRIWTVPERLKGATADHRVELPLEVLGTKVKDTASGFSGIATAIQLHISGCLHVVVQPQGVLKESGERIEPFDFDIRRLEGKAIKQMTEEERDRDQVKRPSPSGHIGLPKS
jgi:hypothetical protein